MIDSVAAPLIATPPLRLQWTRRPATALRTDEKTRADWDRLNAARGDLPFLCADAIAAALEAFGSGGERLWVGHRDAEVAAMLVVAPSGLLRWQTFQPSQIPLGAWVAEREVSALELGQSALGSAAARALALSMTQLDPRFAPRQADGPASEHRDYIETGWIDVHGSFDDYWNARGKNLRQNMRKQRNKLAAEGTQTTMRVWTQPEQMAPALARYGALESAGWKAGEGTAVHPDNAQGRFYRRLLEDAARRGEAVVYEYLFDERTVAINLCLRRGGVLVVLKTTYDESIKTLSPAFLLREAELQSIFGAGEVQRIEYYGRLMEWHTKLTENKRALYHLTLYRWPFLKALARRRRAARQAS